MVPYVFDQMAVKRLSRTTYSLFTALLPAIALIIDVIVLTQIPQPREVAAVGLVIAGEPTHQNPQPRGA